ncbi:hypothetical protein Leryth_018080, partial [Lithospermum erythrorhizon]
MLFGETFCPHCRGLISNAELGEVGCSGCGGILTGRGVVIVIHWLMRKCDVRGKIVKPKIKEILGVIDLDARFKKYYYEGKTHKQQWSAFVNKVFKVFTIEEVGDADDIVDIDHDGDNDDDRASNVDGLDDVNEENIVSSFEEHVRLDERCWTRDVRPSIDKLRSTISVGSQDTTLAQRYQQICDVIVHLFTRVCTDPEASQIFLDGVLEAGKKAEDMLVREYFTFNHLLSHLASSVIFVVEPSIGEKSTAPKFKERPNPIKSKKRLKSDYEKARQRQKFIIQRKKQKRDVDASKNN